jgi:hypothetical protein
MNSLKAMVSARLLELCKQHPDALIVFRGEGAIKAQDVGDTNHISLVIQITCIEGIETWLTNQHPHKQTQIQGF